MRSPKESSFDQWRRARKYSLAPVKSGSASMTVQPMASKTLRWDLDGGFDFGIPGEAHVFEHGDANAFEIAMPRG